MSSRVNRELLIRDIGQLVVVPPGPLAGKAMRSPTVLTNAALHARDGKITWFGRDEDAPRVSGAVTLSAEGGTLIPGLIDCHTHIPFAGNRIHEFVRRLDGESYLAIMQSGGGIRVTTAAVRASSLDDLVNENLPRLRRMLESGVTTAECKSGYGLSPEAELRQLEAIQLLASRQPIELVPTYMGAHAIPAEYDGRPDAFIDRMSEPEFLRLIVQRGLARFADIFCDRGAFEASAARRFLIRAMQAGLKIKLHADELAQIGASRLAGELRATSADHLERIDPAGMAALKAGGVVPVVLPGTSFFLGIEHAAARTLIEVGLPVALGTDLNPGSCHIESLPLVMQIACCQLRLLPCEALSAATANAAAAIGAADRLGAIAVGFDADLVILDCQGVDEWLYCVGQQRVRTVIKRGELAARSQSNGSGIAPAATKG